MKSEEAIEQFRERLSIPDYRSDISEYYQAMETAISALDKQSKKKVIKAFDESVNQHWCSCPVCAKGLGWYRNIHVAYCPSCGQAIDWSAE